MISWIRTSGLRLFLAFGLSFALWAFVSFSENPDSTSDDFSLNVEIEGLESNLVRIDSEGLPNPELPQVNVAVRADENTLGNLRQSDLRAFVDLRDLDAGDYDIPIQVESANPTLSLRFTPPDPESLTIRLDEIITQTVPIYVEIEGSPPFSFERGNAEVSIDGREMEEEVVQVSGPSNRVVEVVSAEAEANIEQLSSTYESSLPLQGLDSDNQPVEGVILTPATVDVQIPIRSAVGLKRVPVIGTIQGVPAPGFRVTDIQSEPPLINLTGSSELLEDAQEVATAPVDISGATGTITREVALLYPDNISPLDGDPTQASVTVRIEQLDLPFQIQLPVPVQIEGADSDNDARLLATATPLVVEITLSGSANAFNQLDSSLLVATVDVSGLDPGTYTLQPQISLPDELTATNIPEVQITLSEPATPTSSPTPSPTPEPEPSPTEPVPPTETAEPEESTPTAIPTEDATSTSEPSGLTPPVDAEPTALPPTVETLEPEDGERS